MDWKICTARKKVPGWIWENRIIRVYGEKTNENGNLEIGNNQGEKDEVGIMGKLGLWKKGK